jgi:hypothetical protein
LEKKNVVLDLDGTVLDSRRRHAIVLSDCVNDINKINTNESDFQDFVSFKAQKKTGKDYLAHKGINNAQQVFNLWISRIEEREYLKYDELYPCMKVYLKVLSEKYKLYLVTARSNGENAMLQITNLGIMRWFYDVKVVSNQGNVALNKYESIKSVSPVAFVLGDTESDLRLAEYLQTSFYPLYNGFRSVEYWKSQGMESYANIGEIIQAEAIG